VNTDALKNLSDSGAKIPPTIRGRGKMVLRHLKRFECTQNTSCQCLATFKIRSARICHFSRNGIASG
ncbi:hypothetical protein, partial [Dysgonomonas macrotermitis]|uniref:hypothetical protein n=1 Tax=Dysgonomonas macrotermitis TaxID=1346286 RepID=UPI001F401B8D